MRYTASIYINDVMDQVVLSVKVIGSDGWSDRSDLSLEFVTQIRGVGETDPHEWLRDALIALVEIT